MIDPEEHFEIAIRNEQRHTHVQQLTLQGNLYAGGKHPEQHRHSLKIQILCGSNKAGMMRLYNVLEAPKSLVSAVTRTSTTPRLAH